MENKPSLLKTSSHGNFNQNETKNSEFNTTATDTDKDIGQFKKSNTLVDLYSQMFLKTNEMYKSSESLSKSNYNSSDFINSPESKDQPVVFELRKLSDPAELRKLAMYQNNLGFFDRYLKTGKVQFNNKEINALAPGSF